MNYDEAIRLLTESTAPNDRAKAARWLASSKVEAPFNSLVLALEKETVPQLRKRIRALMARRTANSPTAPEAAPASEETTELRLLLANAAAIVRHETDPKIGLLHLEASKEIADYKASSTYVRVLELEHTLDVVTNLLRMEHPPVADKVSLSDVINSAYASSGIAVQIETEVFRHELSDLTITTDPTWLEMIISNALRNAERAMLSASGSKIDIKLECNSYDFSIIISNPFAGHEFQLSDVAQVGASTRSENGGRGLYIVHMLCLKMGYEFDIHGKAGVANFVLKGDRNIGTF